MTILNFELIMASIFWLICVRQLLTKVLHSNNRNHNININIVVSNFELIIVSILSIFCINLRYKLLYLVVVSLFSQVVLHAHELSVTHQTHHLQH